MRVLLVNTYDRGGAANACYGLHCGLMNEGVSSNVLLRKMNKRWRNAYTYKSPQTKLSIKKKISNRVLRILNKFNLLKKSSISRKDLFLNSRRKGLEIFSFPDSGIDITTSDLYNEASIINLHWVANFLDYSSFFEKNKKPVVWTLHDMNPFSGGEHYEEKYFGIDELGYPKIREVSEDEISILRENIKLKRLAISNVTNLTIIAPSEWLASKARESEVFKNVKVHCIPNGLDSRIFSPREKNYSRNLLNIPLDKKVILFVADSIDNNRKGFIFLKQAFEQLDDTNLVLCAIGNKNSELESLDNIVELGPIDDERLMSVAYSAADVFVIPSLMDNLPNTVLESLMCGTPVIGFPIGGIPDMIQDGVNGFLTQDISVNSLVIALKKYLNNISGFNRIQIREDAVQKYDQKVQSKKYIDLFKGLLKVN